MRTLTPRHLRSARAAAYGASKGALLPLTKALAVEYGKHGIRANAILPGWTRSDMTAPLQAWDTFDAKAIGRVPLRRWGEPEDFGGIAVYLASDASRFHTGDTLVIDGGYTVFWVKPVKSKRVKRRALVPITPFGGSQQPGSTANEPARGKSNEHPVFAAPCNCRRSSGLHYWWR